MFTNKELLEQWANDAKRREFANNYSVWGVWFTQPELGLAFYKYDLPGGGRLIAMEYLREPYSHERDLRAEDAIQCHKLYLQPGKYFIPVSASEHEIAEKLKKLKETLSKEQKQRDRQCRKCGSKCFQHKQDGSVHCAFCMSVQ